MRTIELFKELSAIPHCSRHVEQMKQHLLGKATTWGYEIAEDAAGNLLFSRGNPTVCLQAHYDMVCIGKAEQGVTVIEEAGFLKGRESSLGADNGIGMAYMLTLMEQQRELEFLFTNDEEIGLLGAKALELPLRSRYLINTDTERERDVSIGCAGGYDLEACFPIQKRFLEKPINAYRITTHGFTGGHSGMDIHKGVLNAITEMAFWLREKQLPLVSFNAGEKPNSIPVGAEVVVLSATPPEVDAAYFQCESTGEGAECIANGSQLVHLLCGLPLGVLAYDVEFGVVTDSLNLGTIRQEAESMMLLFMGRANDNRKLERNHQRLSSYLEACGCKSIKLLDCFSAWQPEKNSIAVLAKEIIEQRIGGAEYQVIHAGFECGVLQERLPGVEMVSIGPNIYQPHSVHERAEVESITKMQDVICELIERLEQREA